MTNAKLLDRLKKLTKDKGSVDKEHIQNLRKVLRKLKKRQHDLEEGRQQVEDEHDRQKIDQEIEVLKIQRKKGVEAYKRLKKEVS